MRFGFILLLFVNLCQAQDYKFGSINHLVEQKIGKIVISKIYRDLGLTIKISELPAKRAQLEAINGISDGEIMRIFSYGIEHPTVHRVPTPYYALETMAFVRRDSGIKISSKEDLMNYRLARVRGVKHTDNISQDSANVVNLNSTKQLMQFVAAGRADVALTNTVDGLMALQELGIDTLVPSERALARLDLYHYIHQDHLNLIPLVDSKIKSMKESGALSRIIKSAESSVFNVNTAN